MKQTISYHGSKVERPLYGTARPSAGFTTRRRGLASRSEIRTLLCVSNPGHVISDQYGHSLRSFPSTIAEVGCHVIAILSVTPGVRSLAGRSRTTEATVFEL